MKTTSNMPFPQAVQDRVAAATQSKEDPNVSQAAIHRKSLQQRQTIMPQGVASITQASPSVMQNASKDYMPPVFTNPSADPESISVDLPSRFAFYDFKDLYVKPLRARHLAKLNKAHQDSSLQIMVEAISDVLSTTYNVPFLGYELMVQDFQAVLHWLKMHSTVEGVTTTTSLCENPDHIMQVNRGELDHQSLIVTTIIQKPNLVIRNLENEDMPNMEDFVLDTPSNFVLSPTTMKDSVEFMDDPDVMDAEFQFLAKLACVLHVPGVRAAQQPSLRSRIEFVSNLSDSDVNKLIKFEDMFEHIGVKQMIDINCKVCGASREAELLLEAHSFLPNRS